jgi:hypothetical protein
MGAIERGFERAQFGRGLLRGESGGRSGHDVRKGIGVSGGYG